MILDLHGFGGLHGVTLAERSDAAVLTDFWAKLGLEFRHQPNVLLGLMNEPIHPSPTRWAEITQDTIRALRSAGVDNWLVVDGTAWSGAPHWTERGVHGDSNASALQGLVDPLQRTVFDVHQYLDADNSGTHQDCVDGHTVLERLKPLDQWLQQTGRQAFLGEFGAARAPECLAGLRLLSEHVRTTPGWLGGTYWSSSRWTPQYPYNLPAGELAQSPQFAAIQWGPVR